MKVYKYPNTIEWKIAGAFIALSMISIIYFEQKYRNFNITLFFILIVLSASAFGVYKQYKSLNKLMEIGIEGDKIIAKRWGGIADTIEFNFSSIKKIEPFEIDLKRKGIKLSDDQNSILIGDSILDYDELLSELKKRGLSF